MEGIVTILGLIIIFIPPIVFVKYLMGSISKKSKFDIHLENVRDKKGTSGIVIAYLDKVLLSSWVMCLGIYLSTYFTNQLFLEIFIICFILFIIINYLDNNNE